MLKIKKILFFTRNPFQQLETNITEIESKMWVSNTKIKANLNY